MRRPPKRSEAALLLTTAAWAAPIAGYCLQVAPMAPADLSSPPMAPEIRSPQPAPRVLTTEERRRIIAGLRPYLSADELGLLSSASDRDLLNLSSSMSPAGAAPGALSGGNKYAAPAGGLRAWPRPSVVTVRIHNPTAQVIILKLNYGTLFCAQETLTLNPGVGVLHRLCKSPAEVKIDGNPPGTNPASIGDKSCYIVGRFGAPPHWALDNCPP